MWAKYAHGIPPGIPDFIFCLGFSFLWTRVPQLAALALHSSPKVGIIVLGFFAENIEGTVLRSIDL